MRLLLSIFFLALIIAVLQQIALAEFLYWRWWWFDVLMHFLGGVLIGGLALLVSDVLKTPRTLTFIVLLIGIGVGWEIFERLNGLYQEAGYVVDTVTDLIMDTIGALVVYSGVKLWK
jgi:VanZ family protein